VFKSSLRDRLSRRGKKQEDDADMTVTEHLEEFRSRLIVVIVTLVIGVIIGFFLAHEYVLEAMLVVPEDVIFIHPTEAFFTTLKIAIYLGIILSIPMIIYQVIAFLVPGLSSSEKKYVILGLPMSVVLFALGVAFAYSVILPLAYNFFIGFGGEAMEAQISVKEYVTFVLHFIIPFGLTFQLPLIVIILTALGILNPVFLRKNRKYGILVIFVMSAFLTPGDIGSQLLMAGPLVLLYEISVLLSAVIYRRKVNNRLSE